MSETPTPKPSCCPCLVGPSLTDDEIDKSFATVLKSELDLKFLTASPYQAKRKRKFVRKMPASFNPIDRWGFFMTSVRTQGQCGACWAMACAKCLSDRYSLLTLGALMEDFSPYAMVACEGKIFPKAEDG